MSHGHRRGTTLYAHRHRLAAALGLSGLYMVVEAVGGWLTGSLALLADAAHMLSDVAALGLSLFAARLARRRPTARHTYGYYRTEILAALVNGAALGAVSVYIFVEAFARLREPREIAGPAMLAIAAGGLVVNLVALAILREGRADNLNVRGAWLHVAADALGSVQAIAAGALIWAFGWTWADPVASALIGVLVIYSSWSLLRETVAVLMEGVPGHIELDEVRGAILELPGVLEVHDLHVWSITSGVESLSAHVVVEEPFGSEVLGEIRRTMRRRFKITHQTIQLEPAGFEEHHPLACP